MTFTQDFYGRRDGFRIRGRELAQIDFLSGPARPHRWQRRNGAGIGINSTQRVGMLAFRAARVEQKIVEVPKNEAVVTLGWPLATIVGSIDREKDLAIHQQGEKLDTRKAVLSTELFNRLWCSQQSQGCGNLGIANSEQCAGARRFQNELVAAPAHIGEPRQHENVRTIELRRSRPIIGNLRFDDDLIRAALRAPEAIFQQAMPRQSLDQERNLVIDVSP